MHELTLREKLKLGYKESEKLYFMSANEFERKGMIPYKVVEILAYRKGLILA